MIGHFIRIKMIEGYVDIIKAMATDTDYDKVLCVFHKGSSDEPSHWHMCIATSVKEEAMRKRMKKLFTKGKGNGHMSIKPWVDDGAVSYCFHEQDECIVVNKGFSPDEIEKAKKDNKKVQEEVKKAKEKASWKLEEQAYEALKTRGKPYYSQMEIGMCIVSLALNSDKYVPNDWLLKAMVSKLQWRLAGNEEEQEYIVSEIVKKALRLE